MVLFGHLVNLDLVCLVQVFHRVQMLLLPSGVELLQLLYLSSKHLIFCDDLLLISAVCVRVLVNLNACMRNVHLELLSMVFRIAEVTFVNYYIGLQVVNNLQDI